MRELIRPTLFIIARTGLFLSVLAWIVGQWWTVRVQFSTLGLSWVVETVPQGVILTTRSVSQPTLLEVKRIPDPPNWNVFDYQLQDYLWEQGTPVTTFTPNVVVDAFSDQTRFYYLLAASYKLIFVTLASLLAFATWKYKSRPDGKPIARLRSLRTQTLLVATVVGFAIAWGWCEPRTPKDSQRLAEHSLTTTNSTYHREPESITNSTGMTLLLIPAGEFLMGSPESEFGRDTDERQHMIQVRQQFYLQTTETTQSQWKSVMGTEPWEENPAVPVGDDYPATFVNWDEANEFCRRLSERDGLPYRLPTEAEWEYACRAGSTMPFSFGARPQRLSAYGWFARNTKERGERFPHPVGRKLPNAFHLYDMHGNVEEFCSDKYPPEDEARVVRGGSWWSQSYECRSAARDWLYTSDKNDCLGFRVACDFVNN